MNLPAPATVPGGVDVHDGLARLCAGAGVSAGMVLLVGTLDAATVAPAPHAEPLVLDGPLYLAQGTAVVQPGGIEIFGVVAWTDQGIPRQLAGRIEGAVSGGLAVSGLPAPAAGSAPPPEARLELEVEAPAAPPRAAPRVEARTPPRAAPAPEPKAAPAAPPPAAPRAAPPTPPAQKPAAGSWAAAVAVSRQTPARPREQPSAHDLGFDEVPDLRAGDVLVHPRFGRCQVSKVSGDKVKVRRQTGALIDLALGVCRFLRDEDDERGRRVYRILLDR